MFYEFYKQFKDNLIKLLFGGQSVPKGLFEASEYFRHYGPIKFEDEEDGEIYIARSTNFRWGKIITYAKNKQELDRKIRDAILTSFEIPSSYSKEATIVRVGSEKTSYALA